MSAGNVREVCLITADYWHLEGNMNATTGSGWDRSVIANEKQLFESPVV